MFTPEGDLLDTFTLPPEAEAASSIRKLGNCWARELSAFFCEVPHVKDMAQACAVCGASV